MNLKDLDIDFYKNIPAFKDFSQIVSEDNFFTAPASWSLILTDIKGSTKAISEGAYKQVNMIGAACITSIMNVVKNNEFPFVFGGDGATLLLPPTYLDAAIEELRRLQMISEKEFKLTLRIGVIDLRSLYSKGYQLKVGKYELSPGNSLAQFRGGALSKAEDMLKNNESGVLVLQAANRQEAPNLAGLSCRLNPLRSQRGHMLTLLCKPQQVAESQGILTEVLSELKKILNQDFTSASPVSSSNTQWKWIPETVHAEVKLGNPKVSVIFRWIKVIVWNVLVNGSLKLGYPLGPFVPQKYKAELVVNSDFKKFDETLRMVIDCSDSQIAQIERFLEDLYQKKKIYYGLHQSNEALMTCVVFSASSNQHIHFIDGSNGGYAMAAVGLKEQIRSKA